MPLDPRFLFPILYFHLILGFRSFLFRIQVLWDERKPREPVGADVVVEEERGPVEISSRAKF